MPARGRRLAVDVVVQHRLRLPLERSPRTEHLVEHDAQAVLVAGRSHLGRSPFGLLRGHVQRGAQHEPVLGQLLGLVQPGGQAKVHQQGLALVVEHDVGRLHVPMHDALLVGVSQRLGQGPHHLGRPDKRPAPACRVRVGPGRLQGRCQRLSRDERGRDVVIGAVLAGLVQGHDVRMTQLGRRPGFPQEPLDRLGLAQPFQPGDLEHTSRSSCSS